MCLPSQPFSLVSRIQDPSKRKPTLPTLALLSLSPSLISAPCSLYLSLSLSLSLISAIMRAIQPFSTRCPAARGLPRTVEVVKASRDTGKGGGQIAAVTLSILLSASPLGSAVAAGLESVDLPELSALGSTSPQQETTTKQQQASEGSPRPCLG